MTVLLLTVPFMLLGVAIATVPVLIGMRRERLEQRAVRVAEIASWRDSRGVQWPQRDAA